MKPIAITLLLLTLTACSSADGARGLLDRIEFGPDEYGTAKITGSVDINPNPLLSTNVHIDIEKHKDKPETAQQ